MQYNAKTVLRLIPNATLARLSAPYLEAPTNVRLPAIPMITECSTQRGFWIPSRALAHLVGEAQRLSEAESCRTRGDEGAVCASHRR
jgi:hypothetical protein